MVQIKFRINLGMKNSKRKILKNPTQNKINGTRIIQAFIILFIHFERIPFIKSEMFDFYRGYFILNCIHYVHFNSFE